MGFSVISRGIVDSCSQVRLHVQSVPITQSGREVLREPVGQTGNSTADYAQLMTGDYR